MTIATREEPDNWLITVQDDGCGTDNIAANGLPLVMAFPRCSSVHTCFMAYPIDIAFIDRDGNILARYENVRPWRMCSCLGAWAVLERPSIIVSTPALQRVPA